MGGLREFWCFCKGVSKSEKMKAAIFSSKASAMARISCAANGISGTGFLIHRSLLLTTHVNLLFRCGGGRFNYQGHLHHLRTCSKPNLDLGSVVYLLGYTEKKELTVGEGKWETRRHGMAEKDWLSLVVVHSDAWLVSFAFYFGARFGFDKADSIPCGFGSRQLSL
ncbi:hypothetical protein EV1_000314 [Malus domestica]